MHVSTGAAVVQVYDKRREMVASPESEVDWGMAEALAFGTLVAEGNHIRLSGQVCASACWDHRADQCFV